MSNGDVIDPAAYAELVEATGAEFSAELLDAFFEEAPTMLGDLRAARAADDAERFRRAAHSLKSNANTFGAAALGARARDLELAGLSADPDRDGAALDALEAAYEHACAALRELRGG